MNTTPRIALPLVAATLVAACADLALEADRVPTSMEILAHGLLIQEGEAAKLDVVVRDQNGEVMDLPSWVPVNWDVEDPAIADVALDGSVDGRHGGETRIFARMVGLRANARIRVNPSEVALSAPLIYVTQGIQTHEGDVGLLAGRQALVRVFMIGDEPSFYEPGVRVKMLLDGQEIFRQIFPSVRDRTPTDVIESELDASVNALIPASAMQPGVRMIVELDPEGLVPLKQGSRTRYPESGATAIPIREVPLYRQIIVPSVTLGTANESVVDWANGLDVDHPDIRLLRSLMPIAEMELEIHKPFRTGYDLTSGSTWSNWILDIYTMYHQEGRRGYYYGAAGHPGQLPGGYLLGLGYIAFPVSVGVNRDDTYTHEVGHNMNLYHAPCGGPSDPDPDFPHSGGVIGYWGYDFFQKRLKGPRDFVDVMTYCDPVWISDYHFDRATNHRLSGDGGVVLDSETAALGPIDDMLVVRGSVQNGQLMLEHSFVVTGPSALPETAGPYRVEGINEDGRTEFSYSFSPTPMEHGGGGFVFLVPYQPEWAETLDRMVLTGPEGTDAMTRSSSAPMVVVTHPATGNIQAIVRDWDGGALPGKGVSIVQITRGIPTGDRR